MTSWHDYDEALIKRGCAILDLGLLTSWREELDAMNRDKLGRPFEFPNSYISFLAFVKVGFDIIQDARGDRQGALGIRQVRRGDALHPHAQEDTRLDEGEEAIRSGWWGCRW
jgi:hypothetical protein